MQRSLFLFLTIWLILFLLPNTFVQANNAVKYKVNANHLLLRSQPATNGAVLGHLNYGDYVTIFKENHGWGQTYYNGKEVWLAKQFLILAENHTENIPSHSNNKTGNKTIYVAKNNVHLRNEPNTETKIIQQLSQNSPLQVIDREGEWLKVRTSDETIGWIAGWLTTENMQKETKKNPLANKTIVLDAGHGGIDSGATGIRRIQEKNLNLITTKKIREKLLNAGANVVMTRTNDTYVSLDNRVNISNQINADLFLSIHYDAYFSSKINGFSLHYFNSNQSRSIAQTINNELKNNLTTRSRGILESDFYVLRHTKSPALLLELGFLTNFDDFHTIQTINYSENIAQSIANALLKINF